MIIAITGCDEPPKDNVGISTPEHQSIRTVRTNKQNSESHALDNLRLVSGSDQENLQNSFLLLKNDELINAINSLQQSGLNTQEDHDKLAAMLEALAEKDPDELFRKLLTGVNTKNWKLHDRIFARLLESWDHNKIRDSLILLIGTGGSGEGERLATLEGWARAIAELPDDENTAELVQILLDSDNSASAFNQFLRERALKFPSGASLLLENYKLTPENRSNAITAIASALMEQSPSECLDFLRSENSLGTGSFEALLTRWVGLAPEEAIATIRNFSGAELQVALGSELCRSDILNRMTSIDLDSALRKIPLSMANLEIFSSTITAIARNDFGAAKESVMDLPKCEARDTLIVDLFASRNPRSQEELEKWLQEIPEDQMSTAGLGLIYSASKSYSASAIEFALSSEFHAQPLLEGALLSSSEINPKAISSYLLQDNIRESLDETTYLNITGIITSRLANYDINEAIEFFQDMPDGKSKDRVASALMDSWVRKDIVAAADWLATLPSGSARGSGAEIIISELRRTDPDAAKEWEKFLNK